MLVLGITGGIESLYEPTKFPSTLGHDAAAVLMEDGKVIAGIEEERINRIKHTKNIWVLSVRFCLESAKKSLEDLDAIAFYFSEDYLNYAIDVNRQLMPELNQITDARHLYQSLFEREFGYTLNRQVFRFITPILL